MLPRSPRRFPAPWTVEKIPGGFIVKDATGHLLAYVYADNRQIVNTLTEDVARRIASNIAKAAWTARRHVAPRAIYPLHVWRTSFDAHVQVV